MGGHHKAETKMAGRPKGSKLQTFNATLDERLTIERAVKLTGKTKTDVLKDGALKEAQRLIDEARSKMSNEERELEAARAIIAAHELARGKLPQAVNHAA